MNPVNHFEIPADNIERAKKFYTDTFGWDTVKASVKDMEYYGLRSVEVGEDNMPKEVGVINGGLFPRQNPEQTLTVYITVNSLDEYIEKIKASGGKVLSKKMEVPGMGWFAYFTDTEGNVIGIWEHMKK
jgi:predicted enzyme related to lactoylglutathione lyase